MKGVLTGNLTFVQFGLFLIKEGLKDIILSFESALKGKEINLKNWAGKKAIEYTKAIIKIAIGN